MTAGSLLSDENRLLFNWKLLYGDSDIILTSFTEKNDSPCLGCGTLADNICPLIRKEIFYVK
jgi:hypothetical protein